LTTSSPYKPLPKLSELDPGVAPVEFNVLVLCCELEDRSRGGIILTDDAKEREELSGVEGMLVAASPMAFQFSEAPADMAWPKPGARVTFTKWAGVIVMGDDGRKYRLMKDKDITGIRKPRAEALAANAA